MSDSHSRKTFRDRLEQMLVVLRGEIMTGKRLPGEFLPSERELVRLFQLSNKLVRVGLGQLVDEGLLVKIPRVGNQVADSAHERKVIVRFGYHSTLERDAQMGLLLTEFHKAHPAIHVQPIAISYSQYDETVKEYMESGMLDVITMNYNNFDHFRNSGRLNLLQEQEQLSGVYPVLERVFMHEERLWVRPFLFSPLILCYNPEHFRDKGLSEPFTPASWEELMRSASKLTVENERFGFYFFLLSKNRWPVFLLQNGVQLQVDRKNIAESVERIIEGISLCRDMIYTSDTFPTFLSGSEADAEELFREGKVSMLMTSYFALNALRNGDRAFDLAPLPAMRSKDTILMSIGLAVNRKSGAQIAAQTLVDFLVSQQAQGIVRQNTYSIPALRQAAEWTGPERMYRPPNFPIFRDLLDDCRLFTDLNMTSEELEAIMKEARLYWSRLQTRQSLRERITAILQSN